VTFSDEDIIERFRQQKIAEFTQAKRSLTFLLPLLILVAVMWLDVLFGIRGIESVSISFLLVPALLCGWWFGYRPLAKLKKENERERQVMADQLRGMSQ
jgi:hypothetical protein